jgi:hypothetical protein
MAHCARQIQTAVYSADYGAFLRLQRLATSPQKGPISEELSALGVDLSMMDGLQPTLNKILQAAVGTYGGVIIKEANKLGFARLDPAKLNPEKHKDIIDAAFVTDENDKLDKRHLKHPPGYNSTIPLVKQTRIRPLGAQKHAHILAAAGVVPFDGESHIPTMGELGMSRPRDHRSRRRKDRRGVGAPIPCLVQVGQDWLIVDVRGMLRQARWLFREYRAAGTLTLAALLDLYTTDGFIRYDRNRQKWVIQVLLKPGKLPVTVREPLTYQDTATKQLMTTPDTVVVGIDVGINRPATVVAVPVGANGPSPYNNCDRMHIKRAELDAFQMDHDRCTAEIRTAARAKLSPAQQAELAEYEQALPSLAKRALREKPGRTLSDSEFDALPWEQMTASSKYINGTDSDAWLAQKAKKALPGVSPETRKAQNEALWTAQRESPDYQRLAVRGQNTARRLRNDIRRWAESAYPGQQIVYAVENLPRTKFGDGRGRREKGWDNFFAPKIEGRWFKFLGLLKALEELAAHKGQRVVICDPRYTSQACPECDYIDPENRHGESYKCKKCGKIAHADEVGAYNIARVAITGVPFRKPESERLSNAPKTVGARAKKAQKKQEVGAPGVNVPANTNSQEEDRSILAS